jgi:hypothetical protein
MERKTFADTALNLGAAILGIGWIVGLAWSSRWPGWVQALHTLVFVGGIYGLGAVGQVRRERRMDEVQLAAHRFGAQWGMFVGVALMVILGLSSPFQVLIAQWVNQTSDGTPPVPNRMFLLGIVSTFFAQEISRVALTAGWKRSKQ